MNYLYYLISAVSIILQLALIVLLVRSGEFKKFSVLFAYALARLGTVVFQGVAFYGSGVNSAVYRNLYWGSDVLLYLLLFLMVITMTYEVLHESPLRQGIGKMLGIVVVAAICLPFVLYHPYFTGRWFRQTGQMLSLGAALLNLILWTAIIGNRNRSPKLFAVSIGVGLDVTSAAIAYGILQFVSADMRWILDVFKALMHIVSLCIWCWAFRPSAYSKTPGAARVSTVQNT